MTALGRVEGGALWQDAVAWRIHEDAVVVARVARPVVVAGGVVTSAGAWKHLGLGLVPADGPLRRRTGVVPVADEVARGEASGRASVAEADSPAAESWAFLPSAVREGAERLVPDPTSWWTTLSQTADAEGRPIAQDIRALRMSGERVVVVVASRGPVTGGSPEDRRRALADAPWVVEQLGFDVGGPPEQITGGPQGQIERVR